MAKKKKWFTRKIDRLVMGAIIGAAVGSVVGASIKKKRKEEEGPVEWFEVPKQEKRGLFSRLIFGKKKKEDSLQEIPDESEVEMD